MRGRARRGVREVIARHYGIGLIAFKENMGYRFAFFTALLVTMVMALFSAVLWGAVWRNSTGLAMSYQNLVTYVCMGQVVSFTRLSGVHRFRLYRISGTIESGDVALDLVRPVDYQLRQLSESFALFAVDTILINLPAYLVCLAVVRISGPSSPEAAAGYLASLLGAFLLTFSFDYLLMIPSFWAVELGPGILVARKFILDILSGAIIPFPLLPRWLRDLAGVLPFQGMAAVPLQIYVGSIEGQGIGRSILVQFAWAAGLILATRFLFNAARRKLVVQGG
jgi:ABC-2 type transport system permease protein